MTKRQTRLTPDERRERARLRSLRWRRAHGIGPRKPAQRPWLAARAAVLDRLQWQMAELRVSLDRCAVAHEAMAAALNWNCSADSNDRPDWQSKLSRRNSRP